MALGLLRPLSGPLHRPGLLPQGGGGGGWHKAFVVGGGAKGGGGVAGGFFGMRYSRCSGQAPCPLPVPPSL